MESTKVMTDLDVIVRRIALNEWRIPWLVMFERVLFWMTSLSLFYREVYILFAACL